MSSESELYIRPIDLRSWGETSRLLAVLGSFDLEAYIRDELDRCAFLMIEPRGALLARIVPLANELGIVSATLEGTSGRLERVLLAGKRSALEQFAIRLGTIEEQWGRRLRTFIRASSPPHLRLPQTRLDLGGRPLVQAILNVTPDSFFDGGRHQGLEMAVARAEQAIKEGADLIDIGGESTRPGAPPVEEEEELARVLPVVETLVRRIEAPISIDTQKGGVARRALEAGAQIINDVSGLRNDPSIAEVVAKHGAGLIVMHMRGTPQTMGKHTQYQTLLGEIIASLEASVEAAERAGVTRDSILIDPGIGFAKSPADNLVILRELGALRVLGCGIMVGASRKSFLQHLFGWSLEERMHGSLGAAAAAVMAGAQVVRVHDVLETRRVVDTIWAVRQAGFGERPKEEGTEHVRRSPLECPPE